MRKIARTSMVGMLRDALMGSPEILDIEDTRLAAPGEQPGNDTKG